MLIQIIYATSQNNVFALKDSCKLPWTCPEDLKNFKKITSSGEINILIMGSATFKSLPVIKNRLLFVLSRNDNDNIDNITYFKSFDEAIKIASLLVNRKIYTISVIGGIDIIKEALLIPLYDKIIYHSIIPITINDERNRYLIIDQSNFKFVEEINHSTYKLLKYII
jgi:dihydrofolate reductase